MRLLFLLGAYRTTQTTYPTDWQTDRGTDQLTDLKFVNELRFSYILLLLLLPQLLLFVVATRKICFKNFTMPPTVCLSILPSVRCCVLCFLAALKLLPPVFLVHLHFYAYTLPMLVVVVAATTVAAVGWLPLDFPFLIKLTLSTCLAIIQQLSKCFSAHLGLL